MENKFNISGHTNANTFAFLFVGAKHQKEIAEKEKEGRLYTIMSSYILLAFCLEAYLNHVGQSEIENWSRIERKLSQKDRLKKICELANLEINYKRSPFVTVKNLTLFRNSMAHGKSERVEDTFVVEGDPSHKEIRIKPDWMKFCELSNLEIAFKEIEELIKTIHGKLGHKDNPLNNLGSGFMIKIPNKLESSGHFPDFSSN